MAKRPTEVTLSLDDCEPNALPAVCCKCGEPATCEKEVKFKWQPPWIIVTILAGLLIYVILSLVLRKTRTAYLPVCDQHKGVWNRGSGMAVFVLVAFILGTFAVGFGFVNQQGAASDAWAIGWLALGAFLIGGLITAAIVQGFGPQVSLITDERLKLRKLARDFAEAVEAQQDAEDAAYDAKRAARKPA